MTKTEVLWFALFWIGVVGYVLTSNCRRKS